MNLRFRLANVSTNAEQKHNEVDVIFLPYWNNNPAFWRNVAIYNN
jgi:hypothetical protein